MCDPVSKVTVREYRFVGEAQEEEEEGRDQRNPELLVLIPEVHLVKANGHIRNNCFLLLMVTVIILLLCDYGNPMNECPLECSVFDSPAEVLNPHYGMYVWPCAVVLAQYVWFHRRLVRGKRILEIGAGVSLPGIVAAKCGAETILSDNAEFPQCLDNCQRSCQMNNLSGVHVMGLTWGHVSPTLLALPPVDIVLASDVFFEPADFEDILSTLHYLMEKNPLSQVWTTYQVRSADWSIEALLYKWELESIFVPLQSFEANKEQLAGSSLPGRHTIEMMIIRSNQATKSDRLF